MKNYCDSPKQKYKNVCLTGRDKHSSFTPWDHVTTYLIKAASWWFPQVCQWSWGRLKVPSLLSWLEKVREVKSKSWVSLNFEKPKATEETFFHFSFETLFFFFLLFFLISLYSLKVNYNPEGWKPARWQPQSPRDAAERMLGLLNSHVDPPNSLLSLCVSVFCLRGSGSEPPTPLPGTCTHTLSRSFFWSPTQLSASPPCQIHHKPWILYLWAGEGQKLFLTSWVTSCFSVWKLQPNPFIFMDWFKFWHCTLVPTRDWGRHRSLFSVSASCLGATRWATGDLHECLFLVFKVNSTVKTSGLDRWTNVLQAGCPGCVLAQFSLPTRVTGWVGEFPDCHWERGSNTLNKESHPVKPNSWSKIVRGHRAKIKKNPT